MSDSSLTLKTPLSQLQMLCRDAQLPAHGTRQQLYDRLITKRVRDKLVDELRKEATDNVVANYYDQIYEQVSKEFQEKRANDDGADDYDHSDDGARHEHHSTLRAKAFSPSLRRATSFQRSPSNASQNSYADDASVDAKTRETRARGMNQTQSNVLLDGKREQFMVRRSSNIAKLALILAIVQQKRKQYTSRQVCIQTLALTVGTILTLLGSLQTALLDLRNETGDCGNASSPGNEVVFAIAVITLVLSAISTLALSIAKAAKIDAKSGELARKEATGKSMHLQLRTLRQCAQNASSAELDTLISTFASIEQEYTNVIVKLEDEIGLGRGCEKYPSYVRRARRLLAQRYNLGVTDKAPTSLREEENDSSLDRFSSLTDNLPCFHRLSDGSQCGCGAVSSSTLSTFRTAAQGAVSRVGNCLCICITGAAFWIFTTEKCNKHRSPPGNQSGSISLNVEEQPTVSAPGRNTGSVTSPSYSPLPGTISPRVGRVNANKERTNLEDIFTTENSNNDRPPPGNQSGSISLNVEAKSTVSAPGRNTGSVTSPSVFSLPGTISAPVGLVNANKERTKLEDMEGLLLFVRQNKHLPVERPESWTPAAMCLCDSESPDLPVKIFFEPNLQAKEEKREDITHDLLRQVHSVPGFRKADQDQDFEKTLREKHSLQNNAAIDGNCLFRHIASIVNVDKDAHYEVRRNVCDHIAAVLPDSKHVEKMQHEKECGTYLEILAATELYGFRAQFFVTGLTGPNSDGSFSIGPPDAKKATLQLWYHSFNHFTVLTAVDPVHDAGIPTERADKKVTVEAKEALKGSCSTEMGPTA